MQAQTYEGREIALNNTNKRHCSLSRRRVLKLMHFCMLGWARIQQQQQVKWNWSPFTDGERKQTAVFSTHGYIKRLQRSGLATLSWRAETDAALCDGASMRSQYPKSPNNINMPTTWTSERRQAAHCSLLCVWNEMLFRKATNESRQHVHNSIYYCF